MNKDKICGSIDIILGCMYSGKTSEVIRLCKKWSFILENILCINFDGDNRYGDDNNLYSHNLEKIQCTKVSRLSDVDEQTILNSDIILINEGQFFPDLYNCCVKWCNENNKKIIVSGLDGDFERKAFMNGDILNLIPEADSVIKLTALCSHCRDGTEAHFTGRLSSSKQQVMIGTSDYVALCRKCHNELLCK
jgi:thymidine kinase